jgi:hypothetical protein
MRHAARRCVVANYTVRQLVPHTIPDLFEQVPCVRSAIISVGLGSPFAMHVVMATPNRQTHLDATALLKAIDQVAHWLPGREPHRGDVLAGVAEMEHRLCDDTLSSGLILEFQVNVRRLKGGPLRTLLIRRAAELHTLYEPPRGCHDGHGRTIAHGGTRTLCDSRQSPAFARTNPTRSTAHSP